MSTIVGREKLDHPSLGAAGGSALHTAIETIYTNIGNDNPGRFKAYSGVANSAVTVIDHNFGVQFSDLNVYLYTGSHPNLTRVANPSGAGWSIAASVGFEKTRIDVTAPSSGGPHTFAVFVVHGSLDLDSLTDVNLTTPPEDGQALVYETASTSWKPGASGDASFKIQSITDPNATIKGGYLLLDDGRELATYDGGGTASTDFGKDLTVSLDTILGGNPANATAYYLYIDLSTLSSAVVQSDTGRSVYAVVQANFVLSTTAPEAMDRTRYVPRAVIKSATSGTVWSGTGAGFATLAFLSGQTFDARKFVPERLSYFPNGGFEDNIDGVSTYADAAGTTPVDGTGGSPTLTATRNTTTPLAGRADLKITKDAANRQGNGVAFACTVPLAYQKARKGEFTFVVDTTHANYVAGDIGLYLYDVTNSRLITPDNAALPAGIKGPWTVTWDSSDGGASIRALFHVASTSALAYDVYLDNLLVGPGQTGFAPPIGNWIDGGAISIGGSTTDPTKGTVTFDKLWYRRVGDTMEGRFEYKGSSGGTEGSGGYIIRMPAGLTINTAKMANTAPHFGAASLGTFVARAADGTTDTQGYLFYLNNGGDKVGLIAQTFPESGGAATQWGSSYIGITGSTALGGFFSVPIAEWAGSVTTIAANNDVDYVYPTGTFDSNSTTSAVGELGALIEGLSTQRYKKLTWPTKTQPGDTFEIQISLPQAQTPFTGDQGPVWLPAIGFLWSTDNNINCSVGTLWSSSTGSNTGGVALRHRSVTETDLIMGQFLSLKDDNSVQRSWGEMGGSPAGRIRVARFRKAKAVGVELATATQSGLVRLPASQVRVVGGNGTGSTNTMIRRFTTVVETTGSAITYADSGTAAGSFTINEAGIYAVTYGDYRTDAGLPIGISKNSATLTTAVGGLTNAERFGYTMSSGANVRAMAAVTMRCAAGDVLRAHTNSGANGTDETVSFTVAQVARL